MGRLSHKIKRVFPYVQYTDRTIHMVYEDTDGFEAVTKLLEAKAVDLLGSMTIISQQAPLFGQKWKSTDPHRVQITKLLTELAAKTDKLASMADKTVQLIFIKEIEHATENTLQPIEEQPDTPAE